LTASFIGAAWPITIWLHAVQRPEQCHHTDHILRNEEMLSRMERAASVRQQKIEEFRRRNQEG
jgi:hypothetical protein